MFGTARRERDQAFELFMTDASGSLGRTAWLLTGNRDAAADLVQAALVKAYVAWPRIREQDALAYTRRILINEHTDRWRKRHGEVASDDVTPTASADGTSRVDDRDRVARMLARLPLQQRTVIVLRYYHDLSEAQTADLLGISVGAVKSAASRGLATLRSTYSPQEESLS